MSTPRQQGPEEAIKNSLEAREAHGLLWASRARLAFLLIGAVLTPLNAQNSADLTVTLVVIAVGLGLTAFAFSCARAVSRLGTASTLLCVFDIATLTLLPITWAHNFDPTPAAFYLKNQMGLVAMVAIALHGLTFRPGYPLAVTGWSVLMHLGFGLLALSAADVVFTDTAAGHFLTPSIHPGFYGWKVLSLAMVGGFIALASALGRRAVVQAVQAEHELSNTREQQADLIAEGKVNTLSRLVAGVAHEFNSPLGAMRSAGQTTQLCAAKLRAAQNPGANIERKVVTALEQAGTSAEQAAERIGALVASLMRFARLDGAEVEALSLCEGLDAALALVPEGLRGEVEVQRDYQSLPLVQCRARELNQVFFTILVNAFEAMPKGGALRLSVGPGRLGARVEIADTGPGIAPARVERLFDLNFSETQGRIGMGLGLPTARTVLARHRGALHVDSTVGEGTRFVMDLPFQ